jgi:hypothetical protein
VSFCFHFAAIEAHPLCSSTIPILLDARAIYRYNRAMKKGGVAKTHGKWWYSGKEAFPTSELARRLLARTSLTSFSQSLRILTSSELSKPSYMTLMLVQTSSKSAKPIESSSSSSCEATDESADSAWTTPRQVIVPIRDLSLSSIMSGIQRRVSSRVTLIR